MTTIAFRNGILAADTRAYSGGALPIGTKQKIHVLSDGSAFGVSTPAPGFSEEIRNWFLNDKHRDHEPPLNGRSFDAIEVHPNGDVFFYHENFTPSGPLATDYIAIGSGSEYAIGAMTMGASAQEAVMAAGVSDPWTGGVVQSIVVFETVQSSDEQAPMNFEVDV